MKHPFSILSLVFTFLICFGATAQYRHQAGVRLGSTDQIVSTGFTYRYHFKNNNALEGILNTKDFVSIAVLYEVFKPIKAVENLNWYYGGGGFAGLKGIEIIGITGIAGLDYQFKDIPINLSIDWKPELTLIESVSFSASTVAVSVRFSFAKK